MKALPSERLSETEAQPLSQKAKALICLQTYQGSFMLDDALAALVGVPIEKLETRLATALGGSPSLQQMSLWATVLAMKVFETKLAGEKRTWELVVQKARAWIRQLPDVKDVGEMLEKLAEKVLGV
jgi:hypothetical protein